MDNITDEILLMVFKYLSTDNLRTLKLVNKRLKNVASDSALHRIIRFDQNLHVSSTLLHRYACQYHSCLASLKFQDCFWIPSYQLVVALQRCTKLKELILTGSRLSITGLIKIMSNNPGLQRLGWSVPSSNISAELIKNDQPTPIFHEIQSIFKRLTCVLLQFDTLASFEQFLRIFDMNELYVYEFGIQYLSDRTFDRTSFFNIGNTYGVYIKSNKLFQICLTDNMVVNRFLHFNLGIMDFVIQTVTKAALTKGITTLLAPGTTNSLCWRYTASVLNSLSFEKIDLSHAVFGKDEMSWLSKLFCLTHLNLTDVGSFKTNLMKAVANNCDNLCVLNLSCCYEWIDEELHGLQAIAQNCTKLNQLNLTCLHIHASNKHLNKMCSIISEMTNLTSLAVPACSLVNNIADNNDNDKGLSSRGKTSDFRPQIISKLALPNNTVSSCSSSALIESPSPVRSLRSSQEDEENADLGCGIDIIAKTCKQIRELEIIDTGFHSAFGKFTNSKDQYFCPTTAYMHDKNYLGICQFVNLQKLTLAGLSGIGSFLSLKQITSECTLLENLSIAHCGLCGHSGALSSLPQALSNCKNLHKFRLDQPHYVLKEQLFTALSNCKQLEILCIISKNGKVTKDADDYMSLFKECPRLVAFFLFSEISLSHSKSIQSKLVKAFSKSRPALSVTILPYFNALTNQGLRHIPYVHLRDVIRFESQVAAFYCDTFI